MGFYLVMYWLYIFKGCEIVSKSIKIDSETQSDLAKNYSSRVNEVFTSQPESNTVEVENIKGEEE